MKIDEIPTTFFPPTYPFLYKKDTHARENNYYIIVLSVVRNKSREYICNKSKTMAEQLDLQQTIFEGLCYGLLIPLIFDNIIVRHVVVEKARYFALHVIFNSWLTYIVFEDAMDGMLNPQNAYKPLHVYSSVMTTAAISGFHIYHMLVFTNLSNEDIIHHVVSCLFVRIIGCLCPFGKVVAVSNLGMCGIPGMIDYFLLACVKHDMVDRITEKYVNRWLNLLLRWPLMLLASYIGLVGLAQGVLNDQPNYIIVAMLLGFFLHSFNAVYYCDKVVGNFHITNFSNKMDKKLKK